MPSLTIKWNDAKQIGEILHFRGFKIQTETEFFCLDQRKIAVSGRTSKPCRSFFNLGFFQDKNTSICFMIGKQACFQYCKAWRY